jgi:hypothetical protein
MIDYLNYYTMNTDFNKKLYHMQTESVRLRKRTVFIDSLVTSAVQMDAAITGLHWKTFTKLQKIKKINEYCKIHSLSIVLTVENMTNYSISNISFCKKTQQIKSINLVKK